MLNIVCHRQSKQPPKTAGVDVEHAYKLRHVVLVCVSMCVFWFRWFGVFVIVVWVFVCLVLFVLGYFFSLTLGR